MLVWLAIALMLALILTLWIPSIVSVNRPGSRWLSVALVLWAGPFVFFSLFHWMLVLVSISCRRKPVSQKQFYSPEEFVAVLMAVCDDFDERSAQSILVQTYANFHLYLCDDSASSDCRARIDEFCLRRPDVVTMIRRESRIGFKAGNLNNALRRLNDGAKLTLIVDADEVLPPFFLNRMVAELRESGATFLQASHRSSLPGTAFQRDLGQTVEIYWRVYEHWRNRFGCPLFLGHGVLIETGVLKWAGGFDESTTSEDIALTHRLCLAMPQRSGRVSEAIWGEESVPRDIGQYKRRFRRWCRQDFELGCRNFIAVAMSQLSLAERLDLIVKQFHIPIASWAYFAMVGVALMLALQPPAEHPLAARTETNPLTGFVGLVLAIAPYACVCVHGRGGLLARSRLLAASCTLFHSLGMSAAVSWLARDADSFLPTNRATIASDERARLSLELLFISTLGLLSLICCCTFPLGVALNAGSSLTQNTVLSRACRGLGTLMVVIGFLQCLYFPPFSLLLLPWAALRY